MDTKHTLGWTVFVFLVIGLYVASIYFLWYRYEVAESFHFFDDSTEWGAMDKLGHFFSSFVTYYVINFILGYFKKTETFKDFLSAVLALVAMTVIEIFDGFCAGYGASIYDAFANMCGVGYAIFWGRYTNKDLGLIKLSYENTLYAPIRPELLGDTFASRVFKDYNGAIYWFGFSPRYFGSWFYWWPEWMVLCVGYGIDGFLGGHDNVWEQHGFTYDYSHVMRTHSVYVSVDVLWHKIPSKSDVSPFVYKLLLFCSFIKLPVPYWECIRWV